MNNNVIELARESVSNITDEYITEHFKGTNYGHENHRAIIEQGCLKTMAGYSNGGTTKSILIKMGLITERGKLTKLGREFLYRSFELRPCNGRLGDKLAEYENMKPVAIYNLADGEVYKSIHDIGDGKSVFAVNLYPHRNK
ncbi:hypothetical protein PXH59_06400 [Xenorhabdus sp. SF857]|uniref:hypothetical protein n=1 Tax=Xenorhabdus bakwenae TaxID=3026967 RepID=UPI00255803C9|nr:hypothetical protein [Xenorhabdus sp. SF857]WFQ80743.1 hypothetical protein PXH59_06400 [Xenorhabdus sp. SF857]